MGWHAFTTPYIAVVLTTIAICFIAWFILYYHVKYSEENNRTMNEYRKAAMMNRHNSAMKREEDRKLIEDHQREMSQRMYEV